MAWCKKEHRFDQKFYDLPESQEFFDEPERHKCAGCAYEQGYEHARNGMFKQPRLKDLDQSQAGTVRHKDPVAAYNLGYEDGLRSLGYTSI